MNEEKKQMKKEVKKRLILEGALKVFCEKGIESATVDDICKKVDCSHGLFYHYYANKETLIADLKKFYNMEHINTFVEILSADASPVQRLKEVMSLVIYNSFNNELFAYRAYFVISELFRKNEQSFSVLCETNEEETKVSFKQIAGLLFELYDDGAKQGLFNTDFTAREYFFDLAINIVGIIMSAIMVPKELRQTAPKPNVNVILSTMVKKEALDFEI